MAPRLRVECHSGYRANERPVRFRVDDAVFEVAGIPERWYEPGAAVFRVVSPGNRSWTLRYQESADRWSLDEGNSGVSGE